MMPFVDLGAQQARLGLRLEAAIRAVLAHGRYVLGPEVEVLERRLARRVGVAHCITCASGTDALQIALRGLGVGAGDEVIVPGFSFVATAESVALVGARPVYVDIDPHTYLLDPAYLEAAITPRTRAIMPVSLFGQCADMAALAVVARRHGLAVLEDAAQSFGASRYGRSSCGLSRVAATSFFPSKPLGAYGDGGALFTDDADLAETLRSIARHGEAGRYHHVRLGMNSRLDTLQAAILLVKLDAFDEELRRRRRVAARYDRLLAELPVGRPVVAPGNVSVHAQYGIQVAERDRVQARMDEAGIPTAIHYPIPLYRQPALADPRSRLPACEAVCQRILSLPMHPYLEAAQQERVVEALRQASPGV
ncbi:DegT/DnrJ/EryC1/StrS family aminotransferase [Halomonas sp. M4R1S46]|uniref:DegT/DnrJ/EryC1/StrS family aminotransferase n=1 Tax=Halomonas sp. M4R1S46 TaxID=2982692 RepID=UPI0021E507EF|nr:DegT/DnrJ/EryC1/StrS family aminotransferase [Halomonas sp. M4R1S46]UYG08923.1 DegT/DnrJ/EryC1/StrS family aminotransferase [Halomonas sp. M4R1S46]